MTVFKKEVMIILLIELSKLIKIKDRLNCTTLKNKNIYWFGKMIIKEKVIFILKTN